MSNIYDALNKSKQGAAPGTPASGEPAAGGPTETIQPRSAARAPATGARPSRPRSRDSELESLRQRVLLELDLRRSNAIVVAGSIPGEGASTLALLFAREMAEGEQRPVLLVDTDLTGNSRSLSASLENPREPEPGFADVLEGRATLEATVRGTEEPLLHFLPKGLDGSAPLDVMNPDRLQGFLKEAGRYYAFIVLDASPLLSSPETGLLGSSTDGVVLVVRAGRTRREIVQKAIRLLNQAQIGRAHV